MKRLFLALAISLIASAAVAQQATLSTSETSAYLVVGVVHETRADPNVPASQATATVTLWRMTVANTHIVDGDLTVSMTGNAEVLAFEAARKNVASGETGNGAQVENFRILKFLHDNCAAFQQPCAAQVSSTTVTP